MKKTLKKILAGALIAGTLAFQGCKQEERKRTEIHIYPEIVHKTSKQRNSLIERSYLSEQYVPTGVADVRGTWYKNGKHGGGGPKDDWDYGWLYLEQYGSNVIGSYHHEYYDDDYGARGAIFDNILHLDIKYSRGDIKEHIVAIIEGDVIKYYENNPLDRSERKIERLDKNKVYRKHPK
jgi:hypothetical protein